MRMKVPFRGALVLLVLIVFTNTVLGANIKDIKKKQQDVKEDISETKQKLQQTKQNLDQNKQQQEYLLAQIKKLDEEAAQAQKKLSETNHTLARVAENLKKVEENLKAAEEEQEKNYDVLKKSIKISYENKGTGYFQLMLEADSFASFLRRVDVVSSVISHNDKIFKLAKEKKKEVEEQKQEVEVQKKNIEVLQKQQLAQKASLEAAQSQKKQYMNTLQHQEKEYAKQEQLFENELDALEETEKKLNAEIQRILSQSVKKNTPYVGGKLGWPAPGYYNITSNFGYRIHPVNKTRRLHAGIDIGTPTGSKIVAAGDGTVILSQWYGGYGNLVAIDHGGGIVTMYAHNSSLSVSVGQGVKKGQQVAVSGNTGLSTGPHLHFEVKVNGTAVDPMGYLK